MPQNGPQPRRPLALLECAGAETPELWRIAQDEASVSSLYRVLGEFCHAFRNRMNSLQLCLYLAGVEEREEGATPKRGGIGTMESSYRVLLRVMDRIQAVCRPMRLDPMTLPFALVVEDRVVAWQRHYGGSDLGILIRPPSEPDECTLDPMRLAHGLDELAGWRLTTAPPGTVLTLSWRLRDGRVCLLWEESPGNPARGRQGGSSWADDPAGVLPLAVLARTVAAHGGSIYLDKSPTFHLTLSWPAAGPSDEPEADVQRRRVSTPHLTPARLLAASRP